MKTADQEEESKQTITNSKRLDAMLTVKMFFNAEVNKAAKKEPIEVTEPGKGQVNTYEDTEEDKDEIESQKAPKPKLE